MSSPYEQQDNNKRPYCRSQGKAKATWALGSYNDIATFLSPMSAHLVRASGVSRGENVLDVACGTGITAITACGAGGEGNWDRSHT